MNQDIYLRKLKAEYDYIKAEYEYQNEIFNKAKLEFDKRFEGKLNLNIPAAKKKEEKHWVQKESKEKKRTKSLDKVYKKLAQKIHPDKKTGDDKDFKKLKESVDEYDMDSVVDLAHEYNVDISSEVDEEDFLLNGITKFQDKIDYFSKTLIMQWYTINEKERVNFENTIVTTLGK